MSDHPTLRELSGLPEAPAPLGGSTLILVDCQNTYTRGVMELDGVQAALTETEELLDRARSAGAAIVHVMHDSGPGSPYDLTTDIGQIVDRVAPRDGERVVVKKFPNSFTGTGLDDLLKADGAHDLVLAGFMTHMCISSTARGAFSLGYAPSVVAAATATRTLPGPDGRAVDPAALQEASLASLSDLFALVVPRAADVPG